MLDASDAKSKTSLTQFNCAARLTDQNLAGERKLEAARVQ